MKIKYLLSIPAVYGLYKYYQYRKNTLIIEVKRLQYEQYFTYGKMYLNGVFLCDTLEDVYRGQNLETSKVYGQTAIPNGKYKTIVSWSPKFNKYLPELLDVAYFTAIRIHSGQTINHTDGCILVGDNKNGEFFSNSKYTNILVDTIPAYQQAYTLIH